MPDEPLPHDPIIIRRIIDPMAILNVGAHRNKLCLNISRATTMNPNVNGRLREYHLVIDRQQLQKLAQSIETELKRGENDVGN